MKTNAKREIVYVSTERLRPFEANPRHNDDAVPKVVKSIETFGFINPIVVDKKYRICAGHTRYKAALAMGLTEVPIIIVPDLIGKKFEAFNVADNKTGEIADWDDDKLGAIIKDLDDSGFDTTILGYTDGEISAILKRIENKLAGADPDDVPEAPKKAITKPGDLWILGEHRLLCGDATNKAQVLRLMDNLKAGLIFTDPPYGVNYVAQSGNFRKIANDAKTGDDLIRQLLVGSFKLMYMTSVPDAAFYIFHASATREEYAYSMKTAGLIEMQYLIWVKASFVLGHADYQWGHEPFFYAAKDGGNPRFFGDRTQPTVWRAQRTGGKEIAVSLGQGIEVSTGNGSRLFIAPRTPKGKKIRSLRIAESGSVIVQPAIDASDVWEISRDGSAEHPTQKPVELAQRAIENSSKPNDIVQDLFVGSGTTIIAAERTARRCFAMDIDPIYCDVAVKRWETFTGKKAVLDK